MARPTRKYVPPSDSPEVKRARNQRNYQERKLRAAGWLPAYEKPHKGQAAAAERWHPTSPEASEPTIAEASAPNEPTTPATSEVELVAEYAETPSERPRTDPDDFGGTWVPV